MKKLERIEDLTQERDVADTRQRQIIQELAPEVLREYFDDQHKDKKRDFIVSAVKLCITITVPVLIAYFSYSLNQHLNYTRQMTVLQETDKAHEKIFDEIKSDLIDLKSRLGDDEQLLSALKASVEIYGRKIGLLEDRGEDRKE